jgi:hypothetical protein
MLRFKLMKITVTALTGIMMIGVGLSTMATAQDIAMETVAPARRVTAMLEHDGFLYTGLQYGGLLVRDIDNPEESYRITGTDGLSDPLILDIAWSGRSIWIATDGGGLTSLNMASGSPVTRQFSNIGDLNVTHVAGLVQGDGERVYYVNESGGLGLISDGLPGNIYQTSNSGLLHDTINAVIAHGNDIWVATNGGVNLLRDNIFTDVSAGMSIILARDLVFVEGLGLVAATLAGVEVYDPAAATWSMLGTDSPVAEQLAVVGQSVWALRSSADATTDRLYRWDGTVWQQEIMPAENVTVVTGGRSLYAGGSAMLSPDNVKAEMVFHDVYAADAWNRWPALDELSFFSISGSGFLSDDTIWMSSRTAAGIAGYQDGRVTQITDVLSASADSLAIYNDDARILDLVVTANDEIWFTQFSAKTEISGGLIRYRPALDDFDHITPDNSALPGKRGIRLAAHPDGPLFIMFDNNTPAVLIDPAKWSDEAQWTSPPFNHSLVTDRTRSGSPYPTRA